VEAPPSEPMPCWFLHPEALTSSRETAIWGREVGPGCAAWFAEHEWKQLGHMQEANFQRLSQRVAPTHPAPSQGPFSSKRPFPFNSNQIPAWCNFRW
jgi:hypothetical protein